MVANHPNLQWQLLTNMLLKKEFCEKGVGCEPFYYGLTQSGFAYEGVDWIATWIFFKLIANTIKLVKEWLTKSC